MMKYIISAIFYLFIVFPLWCQTVNETESLSPEDMLAQHRATISSQVKTMKMLIDIENMRAEIGKKDENELIQESATTETEILLERFKRLETLKLMQIEYLESKEEQIDHLLTKFNEIEQKSKLLENQ